MNAPDPKHQIVQEWLQKAHEDFMTFTTLHAQNQDNQFSGVICFHAQQCIEKLLKAAFVRHNLQPNKTHNLVELSSKLSHMNPAWHADEDDLRFLTFAAVEFRYPGAGAEKQDADEAAALAMQLRTQLLNLLT